MICQTGVTSLVWSPCKPIQCVPYLREEISASHTPDKRTRENSETAESWIRSFLPTLYPRYHDWKECLRREAEKVGGGGFPLRVQFASRPPTRAWENMASPARCSPQSPKNQPSKKDYASFNLQATISPGTIGVTGSLLFRSVW